MLFKIKKFVFSLILIFPLMFVSCAKSGDFEGTANAVCIAQDIAFSSFFSDFEVKIKSNHVTIDGEYVGELKDGIIPQYILSEIFWYNEEEKGEERFSEISSVETCYLVEANENFKLADKIYFVKHQNTKYMLYGTGSTVPSISRVFFLEYNK